MALATALGRARRASLRRAHRAHDSSRRAPTV